MNCQTCALPLSILVLCVAEYKKESTCHREDTFDDPGHGYQSYS